MSTPQKDLPLSIPVWLAVVYIAMLVFFIAIAGGKLEDVFAVAFVSAFTFQLFWFACLRGLAQQEEAE